MKTLRNSLPLHLTLALFVAACGDSGTENGDDPLDPNARYSVSGTIYDLETGEPLEVAGSVSVSNVSPTPSVTTSGAGFIMEGVPANSTFHALASAASDYRSTYNLAIEVGSANVEDVELFAVRESYLAELVQGFGLTPAFGTGIIIARAYDENGQPYEGLPADAFDLPSEISGPYFLDADLKPNPVLTATSTSGFVVLFDVSPGLTTVGAVESSGYGLSMPTSPVAASTVTYTNLTVREGGVEPLPTNVSFQNDIAPIFITRGCVNCHDGGGVGKDLGGLHLNGASEKMYRELTEEMSPTYLVLRVDRQNPAASLMLTMPSLEDPPDRHPFATFTGSDDPDYQMILAWIAEGAVLN